MSANNGIYILETIHPANQDWREYRVVHAGAIENIYFEKKGREYDEPTNFGLWEVFGRSRVTNNELQALKIASRMADKVISDCGILEYGISTIRVNRIFPENGFRIKKGFCPDCNIETDFCNCGLGLECGCCVCDNFWHDPE